MKTKYFILFGLALSVAACSEDEVIQSSGSDEIKLGVTTGMISRAEQIYSSTFLADSFYVSAYTQSERIANDGSSTYVPYIYNAPVKDINNTYVEEDKTTWIPTYEYHEISDHVPDWQFVNIVNNEQNPYHKDYTYTAWKVGPKYLWPDEPLDFYALRWEPYQPLDNCVTTAPDNDDCAFKGEKALKVENFQLLENSNEDITQLQELLYAVTLNQTKDGHKDGSPVSLYFRHALSAITVKIVNKSDNLFVDVKKFSICGIKGKGDLYIRSANTNDDSSIGSDGCYWDVSGDASVVDTYKSLYCKLTGKGEQEYADAKSVLLVIPQHHDKGSGTTSKNWSGVYLKVNCLIKYIDGSQAIFSSGSNSEEAADLYIPLPDGDWQPGYRYNYTLNFGGTGSSAKDSTGEDVFVPIDIEASTADWNVGSTQSNAIGPQE